MTSTPLASGPLLWVRAVVLSLLALTAGAFAHVQAAGLLPGPGVLVVLAGVGTLAAAPFLRRQGSTPRLVLLLVGGQSLVHVALSATAGHRGESLTRAVAPATPAVPAPTGRTGSYFDVAYAPVVADHGGGLSVPAPLLHAVTDAAAHPVMAVAHLLAAALCGWWLAVGERALWRLLALATRSWADLLDGIRLAWAATSVAGTLATRRVLVFSPGTVRAEPRPALPVLGRSLSRRGPPLAA